MLFFSAGAALRTQLAGQMALQKSIMYVTLKMCYIKAVRETPAPVITFKWRCLSVQHLAHRLIKMSLMCSDHKHDSNFIYVVNIRSSWAVAQMLPCSMSVSSDGLLLSDLFF